MYIQSLELSNFRNYESLKTEFSEGTNILYGDNAQGKTNILEALYMLSICKSYRGQRDRDLIRFGQEEAHIRSVIMKGGIDYTVNMHLSRNRTKGIAVNGQKLRKASQLVGLLHIVFFSPDDLRIIKDGPSERRRFMDMELCQLDQSYLFNLAHYNKIIDNRNRLLKDIAYDRRLEEMLDVDLYINGLENIFSIPEYADIDRARGFMKVVGRKKEMTQYLLDRESGMIVTIGAEHDLEPLKDYSIITATYSVNGRPVGKLGVVGPTRMKYGEITSVIEYLTQNLDRAFGLPEGDENDE